MSAGCRGNLVVMVTGLMVCRWFLLQCKRVGGAIHATDVHRQIVEKVITACVCVCVFKLIGFSISNSTSIAYL